MKIPFIVSIICFNIYSIFSQQCNCAKELEFVVQYYENNLPGFADNVRPQNQMEYSLFKNDLDKKTQKFCDNKNECLKILTTYVEYFKDNHSSIYSGNPVRVDEQNPESVEQFLNSELYKTTELLPLPDIETLKQNPISQLEGIYSTADSVYTVAVIKNKTEFRDYVGIIIDSKTKLWKKGQVKFELKEIKDNVYDIFMYMRNHSLSYSKHVVFENGIIANSWYNLNLTKRQSYSTDMSFELVFREIDDNTNYIRIPTFSGSWFAQLTGFYQYHDSIIQAKPYLIIDVRNNGGGSDACVQPLLKYMFTKPFVGDKVEIYATKDHINTYETWYTSRLSDTLNYPKELMTYLGDEIRRMKEAPDKSFILRGDGQIVKDTILPYPQKVAIITNRNCASSCETLLFWARESDKTVLVGENSGGYVGYGEVQQIETPAFQFILTCTMTRFTKQREFEVDGIPPHHYLDNHSDWIEQTAELLNKK